VLEGFDAAGAPKLRPSRTPITLRHLLTHSSGFVYDMWNADMARYLEVTGKPGIISCTNAALDLPLVFDPGTAWDYGIGIDWAGKAVEAVSGKTLGVWLAENLSPRLACATRGFASATISARAWRGFMPARRRGSSPPTWKFPSRRNSKWAAAAFTPRYRTIFVSLA
jgi:CubicO group peptidase (beta-lactamase class C family)